MKILAIGDPHGDLEKVKNIPLGGIDLILLTGDLGKADLMRKMAFDNIRRKKEGLPEKKYAPQQEKRAIMEAYTSSIGVVKYLARHAPVWTIYGNVELRNPQVRKESKELGLPLPFLTHDLQKIKGVRIINNRLAKLNSVRIGGLDYFVDVNWVRNFKPSEYVKRMKSARKETDKAREVLRRFGEVDILVCHQPPFGICDLVGPAAPEHWRGKHAGSETILQYIKRQQPKYVFCGHIHEGEGMKEIGKTEVYNLGACGYKVISF